MIEGAGVVGAWKDADGKRQVGDTLPVGNKLKQLCRTCGASVSDEALELIFAQLGGVGATCNFETFMRLMCEHNRQSAELPTTADSLGAAAPLPQPPKLSRSRSRLTGAP